MLFCNFLRIVQSGYLAGTPYLDKQKAELIGMLFQSFQRVNVLFRLLYILRKIYGA